MVIGAGPGGPVAARVAQAKAAAIQRWRRVQDGAYFRMRETSAGRAALRVSAFARAPLEWRRRHRLAADYNARVTSAVMDPAKGYCLLPPGYFAGFEPVFDSARRIFEAKRAAADERPAGFESWSPKRRAKFLAQKRSFLHDLLTSEDLAAHPELVEFALSARMLGIVTRYLGMVPYLRRVDLVYSQPREADDNVSSQLYHRDPEGLKQVKFFVYLYDVDEPQGPFTLIPADESDRVVEAVRVYRRQQGVPQATRYRDEELAAVGPYESVCLKGPRGTGVAVDTSRCLHLGSRVQAGAFRVCLFLQYCSTAESGSHLFDAERFRADPLQYLAVSHSPAPRD